MACEDSGLRVGLKLALRERAAEIGVGQARGTSASTPNVEVRMHSCGARSGVYSLSDAMTCGAVPTH